MKQVRIAGERRAELVERPTPTLRDGWALVHIEAAPLCAEYKIFRSGRTVERLGHEAAGTVVECAGKTTVQPGDRVVVMPQYPCGTCEYCRSGEYIYCEDNLDQDAGTMAEYIAKPAWLLVPIPENVPTDLGSLACCGLGPSYGALARAGASAGAAVLVTGLGPVGLGAVVNGVYRGLRVIGVDGNAYRSALARDLGAVAVLDPHDPDVLDQIRALAGGRGPVLGVDCSGQVSAHRLQIDAAARRACLVFVGESTDTTPIRVSPDLIRKGLTVMGSWHYALTDVQNVMRVIQEFPGVERLVTHRFPLARVQEAFEVSESQQCGKVILQASGGESSGEVRW